MKTSLKHSDIWSVIARGSHSFTCYPHINHTCLYFLTAEHHCPLVGTHCDYPRRDGQTELTWEAVVVVGVGNGGHTVGPSQMDTILVDKHTLVDMLFQSD